MMEKQSLDPLDILLLNFLENRSKSEIAEIVRNGEEGERIKINSNYVAVLNAFRASHPEIDVAGLLRAKLKSQFNNEVARLFGEIQPHKLETAPKRLQRLIEDVPSMSGTAFVDLVKFVGGAMSVTDVYKGSWISEKCIQHIADLLWIKVEWIEKGVGAVSPLISRTGILNPIVSIGDQYSNALCVKSEVSILVIPDDSRIVLQRGQLERDGMRTTFLNPIAAYEDGSNLNALVQSTANAGALINCYEVSGDRWREYVAGELPLMGLYKTAKASSYVPE